MNAGQRLTSHLIGVFDASSGGLFHDVFALVVLQHMFKSPSFLGDAQIQHPHEVASRGRWKCQILTGKGDVSAAIGCAFSKRGVHKVRPKP